MGSCAGHLQAGARASRDQFALALQLPLASHHHPVLAAVMVPLEADALAGMDAQPLHQVAITCGQDFKPAPGSLLAGCEFHGA